MANQTIYVEFVSPDILFFDENEVQFKGNLVAPPEGAQYIFKQKSGSSGWVFDAFAVDLVDGPDVAEMSWIVQDQRIQLTNPGNGNFAESNYDYTLTIRTTVPPIETVSIDPKIKNTGGN